MCWEAVWVSALWCFFGGGCFKDTHYTSPTDNAKSPRADIHRTLHKPRLGRHCALYARWPTRLPRKTPTPTECRPRIFSLAWPEVRQAHSVSPFCFPFAEATTPRHIIPNTQLGLLQRNTCGLCLTFAAKLLSAWNSHDFLWNWWGLP